MDPLDIAIGLAQFAPSLVKWLTGSDKAVDVAAEAVKVAQTVTGKPDGASALQAIQADPNLALQYQQAILAHDVQLAQIAATRARDEADADNRADEALTNRMALMEGTAADLKGVPYLGAFMLFLRGSQRIVISYGTAWIDYLWLSGAMGTLSDMQSRLLFTVSILVFIVLFGERAVKNVAPLLIELLGPRSSK